MTLQWIEWRGEPQRYSYWQRGFNDGYAGKHEELPTNDGEYGQANRGYLNGYRAGREKFDQELMARLRMGAL